MIPVDTPGARLVNAILLAGSQTEVKNLVDTAFRELQEAPGPVQPPAVFMEQISDDLGSFNPINQGTQQWTNIKMARILLNRMKSNVQTQIT